MMKSLHTEYELIDSNLLVHAYTPRYRYHEQAKALLVSLTTGERRGAFAHQNLLEFYATMTNPKKHQLVLTAKTANELIEILLALPLLILYPTELTLELFLALQRRSSRPATGLDIYDWYLAATALSHGLTTILTENTKDFVKIPGITAINPFLASGKT